MSRRLPVILVSVVALLTCASAGLAAPPGKKSETAMSTHALSGSLRGLLVQHMPSTLYEAQPGWGQTSRVPTGIKWTGRGLRKRAEVTYGYRNDGTWRKMRVTTDDLANALVFDIRGIRYPEPDRMQFDVFTSFDVRVFYHQQNWESGIRLYDGTARARLRVKLNLTCEAVCRVESTETLVPDMMFRLRVLKVDLKYDHFVMEHIAGVGGEAAKWIGDALRAAIHRWHPELERRLLSRANAAIVEAADTKEVRLSLKSLLQR